MKSGLSYSRVFPTSTKSRNSTIINRLLNSTNIYNSVWEPHTGYGKCIHETLDGVSESGSLPKPVRQPTDELRAKCVSMRAHGTVPALKRYAGPAAASPVAAPATASWVGCWIVALMDSLCRNGPDRHVIRALNRTHCSADGHGPGRHVRWGSSGTACGPFHVPGTFILGETCFNLAP
jgi:hypothetical protein